MAIKGVDHVVIRVEDFDAAVATWKDKLGMALDRTDESEALGIKQAFFNMDNGGYVITECDRGRGARITDPSRSRSTTTY